MSFSLDHPDLGTVIGNDGPKVSRFFGVQYATLENRLANAQLKTYSGHGDVIAEKHGPSAISMPNACDMEHMFIQQTLPHGEFSYSDTECLNLNVFVPKTTRKDLPVFMFIHGGGFAIGSNAWPQYDLAAFVRRSVERDTPVIAININYRLGVFGFLTSQELRDAGFSSNNGLSDQLVAIKWVQRYIAGFGGDTQNITVAGESAGAVSALLHATRKDGLFKRVMSMGGTPLLLKPLPGFVAEATYSSVVDQLGLASLTAEERVRALLTISAEDVLSKVPPSAPLMPVVDGSVVPTPFTFSDYASISTGQGCESLLIGDCAFDENDPKNLQSILEFAHDIGFYAPAVEIAKAWPQKAYLYHFNEVNPWDGRWKGFSSHIFDVALLFQNYQDMLSKEQQEVALKFCDDVLDYVSGKEPFPSFKSGEGGARVYGPGSLGARFIPGTKSEDVGRRSVLLRLSDKVGLDTLSHVWDMFMIGQ
ncbi:putative carboxylesterase [Exophiala viscosa]|uniref:Carboxylic ester hydrolase n=1 Tax=Exophiala viscosa TaxID=2486360 RepID=A0AAN6DML6_9EURO|nr:putative carboxylesterase [Exophiala viscosa]